jgi:hypothetical protein
MHAIYAALIPLLARIALTMEVLDNPWNAFVGPDPLGIRRVDYSQLSPTAPEITIEAKVGDLAGTATIALVGYTTTTGEETTRARTPSSMRSAELTIPITSAPCLTAPGKSEAYLPGVNSTVFEVPSTTVNSTVDVIDRRSSSAQRLGPVAPIYSPPCLGTPSKAAPYPTGINSTAIIAPTNYANGTTNATTKLRPSLGFPAITPSLGFSNSGSRQYRAGFRVFLIYTLLHLALAVSL